MDEKHNRNIIRVISQFIKSEVKKSKSEGVVIGMSGGVDSSVAACLAVNALGAEQVFGLILPDSSVTPKNDTMDAEKLATKLGIKYKIIQVGKAKDQILRYLPNNKLARANFLVRLRMSILYYYAALVNRLVLGTGNKSELILGYFTKYGDAAVDLMPIGDLYKSEVRELAEFMQISSKITRKKSSARLWRGQTTEGEIGLAYEKIDFILKQLENLVRGRRNANHRTSDDIHTKVKINRNFENSQKEVRRVLAIIEKSGHKHTPPPICRIG
ncbi:MAG: NAD+ synthase [Nitrososphaeraceae archaeon]